MEELKRKQSKKEKFYMILSGSITGICNGLFGGGGGMVIVPLLQFLLKKSEKTSHATAILIILPISIASAITYILTSGYEYELGLTVGGGVIVGGALGALLLNKLPNKWIVIIFSAVMLAAGVKMAFF